MGASRELARFFCPTKTAFFEVSHASFRRHIAWEMNKHPRASAVSTAEAKGVIMKTARYLVDSASPEHQSKNAEKISTLMLRFLFFGRVHGAMYLQISDRFESK
jgi:predicted N-formylglutamate amidohydrolase